MIALIEAGAAFEPAVVRFMAGEHKSPAYKQINPKEKVQALIINGKALTEKVAILRHLHRLYPNAALFPATDTAIDEAR